MSAYPPPQPQRCPRCQYPIPPGAATCANCGLALSSAQGPAPGAASASPFPPAQPGAAASYSTLPSADPYREPAANSGATASTSSQQSTIYGSSISSASTVASPLYPSNPAGQPPSQPQQTSYPPTPPGYPGSQPQERFGPMPAPGSQPQEQLGPMPTYPTSQPYSSFGPAPAYPGSQPTYPGNQTQSAYGPASTLPGSQPMYPTSQPHSSFGPAPAYPGTPPPGGFPGSPPAPPVAAPPQIWVDRRSGSGKKITIITLVTLVILSSIGAALYLLTRPKPIISVISTYKVGSTPAGAVGTTFQFTGSNFSHNSAITFLLDSNPAPSALTKQSDNNGSVTADLKVTAEWPKGNHTLSAKDASGYEPKTTATITIVDPGQAHTPGPNGAPPDDTSFNVTARISAQDAVTGEQLGTFTDNLVVTGKPDPAGGTVCDPKNDTGQPITQNGTSNGINYRLTYVANCEGTYKGGKLTYTETATSYQIVFDNGLTCQANVPFVAQKLEGSFTDTNTLSGTMTGDAIIITCNNGTTIPNNPQKGTWTGTKS